MQDPDRGATVRMTHKKNLPGVLQNPGGHLHRADSGARSSNDGARTELEEKERARSRREGAETSVEEL